MLTKEECEKALDSLRVFSLQNLNANLKEVTKSNDVIEQLTKEHFDNPPLKFEELKLYIPFWDKKENEWCYFTTLNNNGSGVKISINEFPYIQAFIFEENRFYRKQVEE